MAMDCTTHAKALLLLLLFLILLLLVAMVITPLLSSSEPSPVSGGGGWQLLHRSIGISAMHMQLLPGDSVVIFDRTDAGRSNLSLPSGSGCPLKPDCTAHSVLLDLHTSSLRPLTLRTDTFCSSASLLPNGTFLQTGGNNHGERAVRSLDITKANANANAADWLEFPNSLSVRRWYASNQILPNGDVIIVGGRRQFSFEFFPPKKQQQLYNFPFLLETSDGPRIENNLYPFLHLLPDGSLFVFANTRAVILDPTRNVVLRTLPPILDSIPRSYPSTGSSVLLPLYPQPDHPATTRAEVLICGGAPKGSYQQANNRVFLPAAKTCGRIAVTDPDPAWTMEVMPVRRVMGDMVLLPTGNVLIVNGAGSGTAGWERADNPVYTPVMYSPKSPARSRFEVMNPSQIPRMYHSSAILDTFGRVLVAGSNPHRTYDFSNKTYYPTELSMEAFHPPYLDSGLSGLRPRITEESDWGGAGASAVGYGQRMVVTFSMTAGFLDQWPEVEVVAIAPSFQTHSFGMNQRMVVLTSEGTRPVGLYKYEADVLAPPTPQIAPPGYYLLFVVHAGVPSQGVWLRFH